MFGAKQFHFWVGVSQSRQLCFSTLSSRSCVPAAVCSNLFVSSSNNLRSQSIHIDAGVGFCGWNSQQLPLVDESWDDQKRHVQLSTDIFLIHDSLERSEQMFPTCSHSLTSLHPLSELSAFSCWVCQVGGNHDPWEVYVKFFFRFEIKLDDSQIVSVGAYRRVTVGLDVMSVFLLSCLLRWLCSRDDQLRLRNRRHQLRRFRRIFGARRLRLTKTQWSQITVSLPCVIIDIFDLKTSPIHM